jgi:mono/diheme cytochrome c family protein
MSSSCSGVSRHTLVAGTVLLLFVSGSGSGQAQSSDGPFSNPGRFMPRNGEVLYRTACQACHMPTAEGASGAAAYPPLAADPRLRTARFPVSVVVRGSRAMPPFRDLLDDEQIAAVVNYVRTHFGNQYGDPVSPDDVKAARADSR